MDLSCAPKCTVGGKPYTLKEEEELYMIEKGLVHKGANRETSYPWIRDPKDLPDNRVATEKCWTFVANRTYTMQECIVNKQKI